MNAYEDLSTYLSSCNWSIEELHKLNYFSYVEALMNA